MAQRNIDFGTYPDDPSADAIRTAFEKVQQNFDQVFTQLETAAVASINKTPGAGVTVNQPTGNVIISANIACVQVSTSTLSIGRDANGANTALITSSSQVLVLDLPDTISNVTNIELDGNANVAGNILANNITANNNVIIGSNATANNINVTNLVTASRFTSNVANGTAPFTVTSQTKVTNLNADLLDGYDASKPSVANTIVIRDANASVEANNFFGNLVGNFANGNSNVYIPTADGNVTISASGNANILVVTGTGVNVAGTLTVTGNTAFDNLSANLANIITGNITTINSGLLQNGTTNVTLDLNGNVSTFIGGNATAQFVVTSTGANIAGTANVTGNANVGNLGAGQIKASANVTAPTFISNVSTGTAPFTVSSTTRVSNLNVEYANVADFINVNTVTGGSYYIILSNALSGNVVEAANANLTFNATTGNLSATLLTGTLTTNAQPNVTSLGTLSSLAVSGNISSGNANLGNLASANYVQGTIVTAAQPSITSLGTLTGLTVGGNVLPSANVTYNLGSPTARWNDLYLAGNTLDIGGGTIEIVGNNMVLTNPIGGQVIVSGTGITTSNTIQNGNSNVSVNANSNVTISSGGNANIVVVTPTGTNVTGYLSITDSVTAGNIYANSGTVGANLLTGTLTTNAQPNVTSLGTLTGLNVNGTVTAVSITANTGVITGNGSGITNITGANVTGTVANATYATSSDSANTAGTVTTGAQPNITSVGTLSSLNVSGNVVGGNVYANSGTIGASLLTGTLTTNAQPNVTSVGTLTSLSVTGNITSGNIDGGNLVKGNYVQGTLTTSGQPNITAVGTLSNLTVTGNISSGNANLGNTVNANFININNNANVTGNLVVGNVYANSGTVKAQYLQGDGSNITNVSVAAGSYILNGTSNVSVTTNSNVNFTVSGNNIANVTSTGFDIAGTLNVTGNSNVGNIGGINFVGGNFSGNVISPIQGNITSLGTLSGLTVNGITSLGNVGNVRISGGSNNQVLVATGTGSNLAFVTATGLTVAPGSNTQVLFNDAGSFAADANLTFDKTTGIFTVTGNLSAGNVSTGNVSGNVITGNLLTGTLTTSAQPNITSLGTINQALIVQANLNAGRTVVSAGTVTSNTHALTILQTWNNSSVQFSALEANITDTSSAANSLLIDLQIANVSKFAVSKEGNIFYSGVITGNGSGLSAVAGANVSGQVNYAATANSVAVANVVGIGNIATINKDGNSSNILYGNGVFSTAPTSTITTNIFTGNGVQTTFSLTVTPTNINQTVVNYNGATMLRSAYSLSGSSLIFSDPPANGSEIEVTIFALASGGTGSSLVGGNSNVVVSANSNVTISVSGNANILTITDTGANIAGNLVVTGNIANTRFNVRTSNNGATTSGNITPNADSSDQYNIIGLTGTANIQIPSGTFVDGQKLTLRIRDDGTIRTLNWVTTGANSYRVIGQTLPTSTTANKLIYVGCVYNSLDTYWDVIAITTQS